MFFLGTVHVRHEQPSTARGELVIFFLSVTVFFVQRSHRGFGAGCQPLDGHGEGGDHATDARRSWPAQLSVDRKVFV